MNKLKIIVRTLLILVVGFFVFKSLYVFTVNKEYNIHLDTGTVISRSSDEVAIKHGSETELYLNVKFDKSGFRAMCVNPSTYFRFKKGDRVSFDLKDRTEEAKNIYFMAGLFFYVIIGIVGIIALIIWAFNIEFE